MEIVLATFSGAIFGLIGFWIGDRIAKKQGLR